MTTRNTIALAGGGAALVILCGVAGFLGARAGAPAASSGASPAPGPSGDDGQAELLRELDRRVGYLEEQVRITADTARAALDLAERLRVSSREPGAGPVAPAEAPRTPGDANGGASKPKPPQEPPMTDAEHMAAGMRQATLLYEQNVKKNLPVQMALLADTSEAGVASRRAQAILEARSDARRFDLNAEQETEFRRIHTDAFEAAARDIGPLVRDGLERADIAVVAERLAAIQSDADGKVRALLTEDQWKAYEETVTATRKVRDTALAEFGSAPNRR